MKKIHYVLGACAIMAFIVIGIFLLLDKPDNTMGAIILPKPFTDLIGTRTASTTAGVGWYGNYAASTTYPIDLLGAYDASFIFSITAASSSSGILFNILGSNDPECSTATTTTIFNKMTVSEIQWFDIASHIANASVVSSFSNGTSSVAWSDPTVGHLSEIFLTDLNMKCAAITMNASSTMLHASYKLKD